MRNLESTVTGEEMNNYAQTYIEKYRDLMNTADISPENRTYIKFYNEYPYSVRCIISNTHGAGIEFAPSKIGSSKTEITNKEIEYYMFNGSTDNPAFIILPYNEIDRLTIECPQSPFKILENGSLLIQDLRVNNSWEKGRIYNYAIIKGSNSKRDWTEQVASEDVTHYSRNDLLDVFYKSEEFRRYLAQPALSEKAHEILNKLNNGSYRDNYLSYTSDYNQLHEIAKEYKVNSKFADTVYNFTASQPEPFSWIDQYHIWDMSRSLFISLIISPAILYFINKFKPKIFGPKSRKRKKRS